MNRGRKPSLFFRTDVFDHVRNHGFFPKQNPNILRLQSSTLKKCLFRVFRYEKLSCPARHQGVSKKKTPHSIGWGDDIAHIAHIPGVPQFHGDVRVGKWTQLGQKNVDLKNIPKTKRVICLYSYVPFTRFGLKAR